MQKKVMILGAGEGQLNIVQKCKNKGYYVIVASIKGKYPCFDLADKSYFIDTMDKESLLAAAQSEKIDAVMTDQTDVSVMSVAYIAEQMGLRGIGVETARKFTNKYEMRVCAKEAGIAVPEFSKAYDIQKAQEVARAIGYPVIIKPVDSSGSRGVFKCSSDEAIAKNVPITFSKTKEDYILVEKFIQGKEYLADGFAMDYSYTTLDVGEKEYFECEDIFVSKMCMFSSCKNLTTKCEEKVRETNDRLIRAFALPFGITHAEYMYSRKDDQVYLVECAARGGGVYLSSDLTPLASGFDTNEALIDYVVEGKKTFIEYDRLSSNVSAWVCFSFPDGIIESIDGIDDVLKIPGVHAFITRNFYVGMPTHTLKDDGDKYGPILIYGSSKDACYEIIKKIKQRFSIAVKTSTGTQGLIW